MTTFKLFDKDNMTSEMQMVSENMDYVNKALESLLYKKELTKIELERCIKVITSVKEYSNAIADGTYTDRAGIKLKFYNSKIKEESECTVVDTSLISESTRDEDTMRTSKRGSLGARGETKYRR